MSSVAYIIGIAQFFLGILIAALNLLIVVAIFLNTSLRSTLNYLFVNLTFSNLVAGVILSVSNIVNNVQNGIFKTTKGSVASINGFVNISTLLILASCTLMTARKPASQLSTRTCARLIAVIWSFVGFIVLCKAIIYALNAAGKADVCFNCFIYFEVALLLILGITTILVFALALHTIRKKSKTTVHDSSAAGAHKLKAILSPYRVILTEGLLIVIFAISFLCYVLTFAVMSDDANSSAKNDVDAGEAVLTAYFVHGVLTPIVIYVRLPEIWSAVKRTACCQKEDVAEPSGNVSTAAENGVAFQNRDHNPASQNEKVENQSLNVNEEQRILNTSEPGMNVSNNLQSSASPPEVEHIAELQNSHAEPSSSPEDQQSQQPNENFLLRKSSANKTYESSQKRGSI